MLISLLQFFTKSYNTNADNDVKQQVRFACSACLITSVFAFAYVLISYAIDFKPGIYVMIVDTILLLALAFLFKAKMNLKIISNLYVLFCFLAVLLCSYYSGGIDSPVTPWLILAPMVASLMVNKLVVWIWVIICSIVVGVYGIIKANGVILEINYNESFLDFFFTSVYIGLILITLLVISVYEKMKTTAIKNLEITRKDLKIKKEQIEEKHVAITDSISYAKRLQNAILPKEESFSANFNNYFIYYQPKDIVSGDFYWVHKKDHFIFFAVADCTGHGVPGAMVSVVCNNELNRAVNEFKITKPNLILDKTKELIIEQMGKGNDDVKDGMDIALCCLDTKTKHLQYSGAHNSIYIIKENDTKITELTASRQSVGKDYNNEKFSAKEFQLSDGDTIYLFTDGFPDQFGGLKSKKYKYTKFKNLILKNCLKKLEDQKNEIRNEFISWKGDMEQIDDVCIMGIKI